MGALETRYASKEMRGIFSDKTKHSLWRTVWIALAAAQQKAGLDISEEQIEEMKKTAMDADLKRMAEIEKETRHDVMAHIQHWGEQCPNIEGIIHLGATSSLVTDNAEFMTHFTAIALLVERIAELIGALIDSKANCSTVVLGYTHFQPAQPLTMDKRVACWVQDLMHDLDGLLAIMSRFPCRGIQGTTGTADSYLALLGTEELVNQVQKDFMEGIGAEHVVAVSGQTISRKWDVEIANVLVGVAASLSKFGNDIRLLSHTGDCYGEFGKKQVGSSAMPYKRNPMKAERICALSRLVPGYHSTLVQTAMTQWLERSLDDSAARRVAIADMFYAVDGALLTAIDLTKHLVVKNTGDVDKYKSFLISERLIVQAVKAGHSRQKVHEVLREAYRAPTYSLVVKKINDALPGLDLSEDEDLTGLSSSKARVYLEWAKDAISSIRINSEAQELEV